MGKRGFNFLAPASPGLRRITLRGGTANRTKVTVIGHGAGLPDLGLPILGPSFPLVIQLSSSGSGVCWEARYDTPANLVRNDARALRARGN